MDNYLQTKGRIFDIQRYSIHDGDGIRTIVFLKGCCLRCRWCSNPESQEYGIQTMMERGKLKTVGRDVTVQEVMDTVLKDRAYYRRTGGGLTLSGGEMLNQPEFSAALLKAAKENGISTAVETTSRADWDVIERMLPFIDQYLMDIKHMDAEKHREYTGEANTRMLEHAVRIAGSGLTRLSIRVPVVPGFNDTHKEIGEIAAFVKTLKPIERLHLLPYHRLGQDKYTGLGRAYQMPEVVPPDDQTMQALLETARKVSGAECQIGG